MDYAEVRAEYQNVDVRRHVMFPYKDYFVIADELRDASNHLYEWRLHGNGGGSSGGSYTRSGHLARWTPPPGPNSWPTCPRPGTTPSARGIPSTPSIIWKNRPIPCCEFNRPVKMRNS